MTTHRLRKSDRFPDLACLDLDRLTHLYQKRLDFSQADLLVLEAVGCCVS